MLDVNAGMVVDLLLTSVVVCTISVVTAGMIVDTLLILLVIRMTFVVVSVSETYKR